MCTNDRATSVARKDTNGANKEHVILEGIKDTMLMLQNKTDKVECADINISILFSFIHPFIYRYKMPGKHKSVISLNDVMGSHKLYHVCMFVASLMSQTSTMVYLSHSNDKMKHELMHLIVENLSMIKGRNASHSSNQDVIHFVKDNNCVLSSLYSSRLRGIGPCEFSIVAPFCKQSTGIYENNASSYSIVMMS